jgi:hypothetical protein
VGSSTSGASVARAASPSAASQARRHQGRRFAGAREGAHQSELARHRAGQRAAGRLHRAQQGDQAAQARLGRRSRAFDQVSHLLQGVEQELRLHARLQREQPRRLRLLALARAIDLGGLRAGQRVLLAPPMHVGDGDERVRQQQAAEEQHVLARPPLRIAAQQGEEQRADDPDARSQRAHGGRAVGEPTRHAIGGGAVGHAQREDIGQAELEDVVQPRAQPRKVIRKAEEAAHVGQRQRAGQKADGGVAPTPFA